MTLPTGDGRINNPALGQWLQFARSAADGVARLDARATIMDRLQEYDWTPAYRELSTPQKS